MLRKHGGDKAGSPSWSAPNKAGCPPKDKCRRSVLEVAKGKRTKTMRPLTRFCQLCLKFSQRTIHCWVQEKNKEYHPRNGSGRTLMQRISLPSTKQLWRTRQPLRNYPLDTVMGRRGCGLKELSVFRNYLCLE
jgi:hypothetical protein